MAKIAEKLVKRGGTSWGFPARRLAILLVTSSAVEDETRRRPSLRQMRPGVQLSALRRRPKQWGVRHVFFFSVNMGAFLLAFWRILFVSTWGVLKTPLGNRGIYKRMDL